MSSLAAHAQIIIPDPQLRNPVRLYANGGKPVDKWSYFPFLMDRWIAGTRSLTLEQAGAYIHLLVWLYEKRGRVIKDADHAARILQDAANVRPQKGRRIFNDLAHKLTKTNHGYYHSLAAVLHRNGMKLKGLERLGLPTDPDPEPDIRDLKTDLSSTEPKSARVDTPKIDACPHQKIIAIYHEICPTMRRVRTWNGQRPKHMCARWREHPSLEWWRGFLAYVSESEFLTGQVNHFTADLEWLIRPNNFQKVNEGKYHGRRERIQQARGLGAEAYNPDGTLKRELTH